MAISLGQHLLKTVRFGCASPKAEGPAARHRQVRSGNRPGFAFSFSRGEENRFALRRQNPDPSQHRDRAKPLGTRSSCRRRLGDKGGRSRGCADARVCRGQDRDAVTEAVELRVATLWGVVWLSVLRQLQVEFGKGASLVQKKVHPRGLWRWPVTVTCGNTGVQAKGRQLISPPAAKRKRNRARKRQEGVGERSVARSTAVAGLQPVEHESRGMVSGCTRQQRGRGAGRLRGDAPGLRKVPVAPRCHH